MRILDWAPPQSPCDAPAPLCRYGLLVEDIAVDGFHCESYGVIITGPAGEREQCRHITTSAAKIARFMGLLVRNGVTPVTLADVVEDWLAR